MKVDDVHLGPLDKIVGGVSEGAVIEGELFVACAIHKVKHLAFAVEILRFRLYNFGVFHFVVSLEGFFEDRSRTEVFDARSKHRSGASGFAVLVVEHNIGIITQGDCFPCFDFGKSKHREVNSYHVTK